MNIKKFNTVSSIAIVKACEQAIKCTDMKHKHGAIICSTENGVGLKNINVICSGYNKKGYYIDSSLPHTYSLHAELDCLRKYNKLSSTAFRDKKYMMLVVRFRNGKVMNSKPCSNCMKKLRNANIGKVYYTGSDGLINMINLTLW